MSTSILSTPISANAAADLSTIHNGHCLDIEHLAGRFYSLTVYANSDSDTAHTLAGTFRSFLAWSRFATVASGGKWNGGEFISRTYVVVR